MLEPGRLAYTQTLAQHTTPCIHTFEACRGALPRKDTLPATVTGVQTIPAEHRVEATRATWEGGSRHHCTNGDHGESGQRRQG